jgi:thiamine-monophosphate kinase
VNAPASEFALIDRHFRRAPRRADVRVGIGDDAAVVAPTPGMELVVSVDMLVEGRHFFAGTDPARLGHKSLAVNLSDLAAMGALPRYALLAGALPDSDDAWLAAFMTGFRALADAFDVELIGGDTTRGPRNVCVTVIGEAPAGAAITRAGARPGDEVYVSGRLGGAALAVRALDGEVDLPPAALAAARERLEQPMPRVTLGLALRGIARAALDISDGLTGDLGHVLAASRAGARIDAACIPADPALDGIGHLPALALQCLLAGGDDYELCFVAAPADRDRVAAASRATGVPCTRIGVVTADDALVVLGADGTPLHQLPAAFDHFR